MVTGVQNSTAYTRQASPNKRRPGPKPRPLSPTTSADVSSIKVFFGVFPLPVPLSILVFPFLSRNMIYTFISGSHTHTYSMHNP